ncbi:MAG: DUF2283 domain-containing protein [Bdellovibrionota bacterium]
MEALKFHYDETGDILYIDKCPPYPEQESEELAYEIVARRNPKTNEVENLEVLFFSRRLLKDGPAQVEGLKHFFSSKAG